MCTKYKSRLKPFLDVCKLRLDFESFTIQGTGATTEITTANAATTDSGGVCIDTFAVTVSTGQRYSQLHRPTN